MIHEIGTIMTILLMKDNWNSGEEIQVAYNNAFELLLESVVWLLNL